MTRYPQSAAHRFGWVLLFAGSVVTAVALSLVLREMGIR